MTFLLILLAVLVLLVLYVIVTYNGLVRCRQQVEEAWSTINTQLKRRYDLIPNLVETVKGYATHEKETLENVIKLRNTAISATGVDGKAKAENGLSGALKSLFALSENYPDLKANTNFQELQQELSDTETKIQATRQFYNTVVLEFNTRVESFPTNLIARQFGFTKTTFFTLDEEEAKKVTQAPQVKFN